MEAGIYCPESLKPAILFFKQIAITNIETEIYKRYATSKNS